MQKVINHFTSLMLDIASLPGFFLPKKYNAKFHLVFICPLCPRHRKTKRAVEKDNCWWQENWEKGRYDIPKHFGVKNFLRCYLGKETKLEKFKKSKI